MSSESLYRDIRAALNQRLVDFPDLIEVAWETEEYTPVANVPYLRPKLMMAKSFQSTCGTDGLNEERGIYQITLVYPLNQGTEPLDTMMGKLRNHFKRGTILTYNGVDVRIRESGPDPSGQHLSVAFYLQANN